MKKLIFLLMLCFTIGSAAFAQTQVEVKKTATVPQAVHNVFHKHKHYNGYKTKYVKDGYKHKHKHTNRVNKTRIKKD